MLQLYRGPRVTVAWEWKLADWWVGRFAKLDPVARQVDVWFIPHKRLRGLPIHVTVRYGWLGEG